ncbi:ABC transporter substrate-binding protein [Skermanella sp. TT6]|uniref:ABC transporter substrate-binding protein n=1 Tax=Skermanella cutis TaxID=2775420 RepID=A0ABX7B0Q8_9PROT|nr:ABC transporter substrate-binding protein [Skermanella sp. TT6]QQP87697.1 ABC transporter substrate-binding protein [Skermanella sp. TT6]
MLKKLLAGTATLALAVGAVTGAANAQISGDTVKIGVLTDKSSLYADVSGEGSVVAAQLAVEEFGGKAAGKPVQIISADHQNKADISSNIARQWFDTEGVDAIADLVTSSTALAVQEVARDKGKVTLISGAATSRLTGDACSPTGFHWAYDTYALAVGTGRAMVQEGGKTWFFLTADYAFGHSLEADVTREVKALGGEVKGSVRHPLNNSDFSSFLLQAQGSGAQVIGLANAGTDTTNSIKQAAEFGITSSGQSLAGLLLFISDVDSLGLQIAQGLSLTTGFYWDMDDETRAWSAKYEQKTGKKPTMVQAGVYSSVLHYLRAVDAAGTDEGLKVANKMKELPVKDMFAKNGKILANGRMAHDMYLARVKQPSQSKGRWDYYDILRTIPADEAYQKAELSGCPFTKK